MTPQEKRQWEALIDDPRTGIRQRFLDTSFPPEWTEERAMTALMKGLRNTYSTPAQMRAEIDSFSNTPSELVFGNSLDVG